MDALYLNQFANIAKELIEPGESYKYLNTYSSGLQSFVATLTFYLHKRGLSWHSSWEYLQNHLTYTNKTDSNESSVALLVPEIYILGVIQFGSEVFRQCANGDIETSRNAVDILRSIHKITSNYKTDMIASKLIQAIQKQNKNITEKVIKVEKLLSELSVHANAVEISDEEMDRITGGTRKVENINIEVDHRSKGNKDPLDILSEIFNEIVKDVINCSAMYAFLFPVHETVILYNNYLYALNE